MSWFDSISDIFDNFIEEIGSVFASWLPPAPREGDIKVRPEELTRTAELCYQVGTNINRTLDEVHGIMTEFFNSDVFEGQQAETVRGNYSRASENLDKFPQMIAWFGGKLEQAAIAFTEADKDNVTLAVEKMMSQTVVAMLPPSMQEGFFVRLQNDPNFLQQVIAQLESTKKNSTDDIVQTSSSAIGAVMSLYDIYDMSKSGDDIARIGGAADDAAKAAKAGTKLAKAMEVAGAAMTVGMSIYDAITGEDQSPEMIAAQITSGLVQVAIGYNPVGAAILAADGLVQFVGPYVADVMRDNADFLSGGGIEAADIIAAADKFDQAIEDISVDARLDGTFKALYSGDIVGVFSEAGTMIGGIVDFVDSGTQLAGYAVGGLINELIPGAGGPVAAIVTGGLQLVTNTFTAPYRAMTFAIDLFTGDAQLGDIFSGAGNFIGSTLDAIGLSGAGDWVRDISGSIASGVNTAVDTVVDFAQDAWNEASGAISDAAGEVGGFFEDVGEAISDGC